MGSCCLILQNWFQVTTFIGFQSYNNPPFTVCINMRIRRRRVDASALNQKLSFPIMLKWRWFEVLIGVSQFTLSNTLPLFSLSQNGSSWILTRLRGRTVSSSCCPISMSSPSGGTTGPLSQMLDGREVTVRHTLNLILLYYPREVMDIFLTYEEI